MGSEWMGGEEHRHLQRKNTETSMHEYKIVKEPYLASRRPAKNRMERSPCVWGGGGAYDACTIEESRWLRTSVNYRLI